MGCGRSVAAEFERCHGGYDCAVLPDMADPDLTDDYLLRVEEFFVSRWRRAVAEPEGQVAVNAGATTPRWHDEGSQLYSETFADLGEVTVDAFGVEKHPPVRIWQRGTVKVNSERRLFLSPGADGAQNVVDFFDADGSHEQCDVRNGGRVIAVHDLRCL